MRSISRLRRLARDLRPDQVRKLRVASGLFVLKVVGTAVVAACVFTPPPPLPEELEAEQAAKTAAKQPDPAQGQAGEGGQAASATGSEAGASAPISGVDAVLAANKEAGDPVDGLFTLEAALEGLEGEGKLYAEIVTARGSITCELFEELTPVTVANFAGLSRGTRPFLDPETKEWVKRPYYNGSTFHRIIPGFMIQGGDPTGTRMGNPGYVIPDEIRPNLIHDVAGVLSMANRGPNTGGAQYFVTLGPTPNLDGKHTVFGKCDDASVRIADDISIAPRDASDKPLEDEVVETIRIVRK